jgi:hypothetical protein
MTLLDATPPKPPRKTGLYVLIAVVIVIISGAGYVVLRNFP